MNGERESAPSITPGKVSHVISIDEAVGRFRRGEMLIVVDDAERENEGDLVIAAEFVSEDAVNFMTKFGRGLICVPLTEERARELNLVSMVSNGTDPLGTAFTVSVDARVGTTTGISVADRTRTIRCLADPRTTEVDLTRPGHIFPLVAKRGGVLRRAGHTEAAIDLARLAGLHPVAVICEILNDDGTMARMSDLEKFAERHGLPIITIADLIAYRRRKEELIRPVASINLPTRFGRFLLHAFEETLTGDIHLALVRGAVDDGNPVLVRAHSECLTGDLFHSLRCDCGDQLETALRTIDENDRGVLLYMRQEGRGIGLKNKLKAYELQEKGLDTVEANWKLGFRADLRDYGIGAQILVRLGVRKLRLLTNNPRKIIGLKGYGLEVVERIEMPLVVRDENRRYLEVKRDKLGHMLRFLAEK
ncbi:MAG: bifunctional 3,4-dihydroxy-2-butanone-4-phosphate synthase/GTP cyclohydrolase II [Candidatus Hydrogenedentota bacterium]|nr:MAG: bifunctional 3,4-dihydroxy-2-butanone-4-phosphate synthase/GTP cyclohydrolase II [Candidatus Hydrogenedentota bacterium]